MKILIIEDDVHTADTIKDDLKSFYHIDLAHCGEDGEALVDENDYDVILLDIKLPGIDGIQVCKNLRNHGVYTPILMVTGQIEEEEIVSALNAGADDYIKKPFSLLELQARIRAVLRRDSTLHSNTLSIDGLILDPAGRTVKREGKTISLRRKEFDLLELLMRNKNIVISREKILMRVWESEVTSDTNTVNVHVNSLRKKVDEPFENKLIKTIHGNGYKLACKATSS